MWSGEAKTKSWLVTQRETFGTLAKNKEQIDNILQQKEIWLEKIVTGLWTYVFQPREFSRFADSVHDT